MGAIAPMAKPCGGGDAPKSPPQEFCYVNFFVGFLYLLVFSYFPNSNFQSLLLILVAVVHSEKYSNKKAVLSQRWPRSAPYTWVPWKFSGLPDYAHGYYSQHFSWAFVRIDPLNVPTKFEVRSFIRSSDNRGFPPKFGQSLDTPSLPFLENF